MSNIVLEKKKIQYNELGYKVRSTAEVLPHLIKTITIFLNKLED